LGFILGAILERYMFISIQRYGGGWLTRPLVIALFAMALLSLVRPFLLDVKAHGGMRGMLSDFHAPKFNLTHIFPVLMLCIFAVMMAEAVTWNFSAKIIPMIVGTGAITFCLLSLANEVFKGDTHKKREEERAARGEAAEKMHMDIASTIDHMTPKEIAIRGAIFFGWMIGFLASMALIGLIPTVPLFIVAFMRVEGNEPWRITLPMAICTTALVYIVFDQLLTIPWPGSVLGDLWPLWKAHMPSA